jgi:3-hydroxyacyl-CoA dehydrogenase
MNIKKVAFIGANSAMGAKTAAIIAAFGDLPVFMIARDIKKAKDGIEIAVRSVRSNSIRSNLIPSTYSDLPRILKQCDWIVEAVAENYEIKTSVNLLIKKTKKKGRIISSLTSGLSIAKLSGVLDDDDRKNYMGVHFFNPPYKMLLCEVIPSKYTDLTKTKELETFLEKVLLRKVIQAKDSPAFVANRIGFQLINEAAIYAYKYRDRGGVSYIDSLLGRHTGRALAPLETLDFVGLDVHKAIIDNLKNNLSNTDSAIATFSMPSFLQTLIRKGKFGNKSGDGLYTKKEIEGHKKRFTFDIKTNKYLPHQKYYSPVVEAMREYIHKGEYKRAFHILKESSHADADIIKYFIARYISYSFSLVGDVVDNKEIIDRAMGFGFSWVPPSAMVDLLGGVDETSTMIKKYKLQVPTLLALHKKSSNNFYKLQAELDYRSLIKV